ncbi:MAG: carbamoyltransferase HypF [Verrucomicrobiae bacterium]|nr:carbamoyltransferase HypF [Verrucomicrobiae bacterium]
MKTSPNQPSAGVTRLKLAVHGAVQGVGFRPFVHRLAGELGLPGWVQNSPQGVVIEVEGGRDRLEQFRLRLETEKPPRSFIQSLEASWLDATGQVKFEIRPSATGGSRTALVLPDIATCPDCLREIFDPHNRRHGYPFTNCTNCGPRFSIIEALPYDRASTTMKTFAMCSACRAEYDDPRDRRFHAQPNACPVCGPRLELWNADGQPLAGKHDALLRAAQAIRDGEIVAVKGIGGFHLLVDARNDAAVRRLRERKQREEKPLALMFPSLEGLGAVCEVSPLEAHRLRSPEAPIVLLRRHKAGAADCQCQSVDSADELDQSATFCDCRGIALSVAPGNPNLGVMLPANPLHHLLMAELSFPVVATSGNLSDEPVCTDEFEAFERLGSIADLFLIHNRPILRQVDDSIVRVMLGREMILRRARGYAPLPVLLKPSGGGHPPMLAVGAHLKNSVALAVNDQVFLSQHIGDLKTEPASNAFHRVIADFEILFATKPEVIAADLHPDYLSTRFAQASGRPVVGVQHHIAHVLSCMAENEIEPPVLGIAWDGTGYGPDGTVWGGEFLLVTAEKVERVAHLRPFRLPGGDKAVKEPRRVALGLLYELYGEAAFEMDHLPPLRAMPGVERITFKGMLQRQFNSPATSSAGRLFDAVASLIDLRQQVRFEGQAAMELEFALAGNETDEHYDLLPVAGGKSLMLDWAPMFGAILSDVQRGESAGLISAKFHNALVEAMVAVAKKTGVPRVALSGGCFQNRYLTERAVTRLRAEQFQPYWHQRVPANDGGIALGQIMAARRQSKPKGKSCVSQSPEKSNESLATTR